MTFLMSFKENDVPPTEEERDSFENELCIHRVQPNAPLVKFCRHCRAPLHPLAAINPFERIYATGFIWRTAAQKPHRLIVVIGVYLYFLPTLLCNALMLRELYRGVYFQQINAAMLVIITPLILPSLLFSLIVVRTTWNYIKQKDLLLHHRQ